jgi:hypothetical protein
MTGWRRAALVGAAVLCALAAVGLTIVAVVVDLSTADQLASVVGAIVGLTGLALSIVALWRPSSAHTVEAGPGAVAAGGNIGRAISGSNNRVTAPRARSVVPPSEPLNRTVKATGAGGVAAGESIGEVITGDGNET